MYIELYCSSLSYVTPSVLVTKHTVIVTVYINTHTYIIYTSYVIYYCIHTIILLYTYYNTIVYIL